MPKKKGRFSLDTCASCHNNISILSKSEHILFGGLRCHALKPGKHRKQIVEREEKMGFLGFFWRLTYQKSLKNANFFGRYHVKNRKLALGDHRIWGGGIKSSIGIMRGPAFIYDGVRARHKLYLGRSMTLATTCKNSACRDSLIAITYTLFF